MHISAASPLVKAPPGGSSDRTVVEVKRLAELMSDGSSASAMEKIQAYNAINRLVHGPGSTYYQNTTQDERDSINDIRFNSATGRAVNEMADRIQNMGMSMDRSTNVAARLLEYVDGLSDVEKQTVFATKAINTFHSYEHWRAWAQENADALGELLASGKAKSSVTVTLSTEARDALKAAEAGKALETLKAETPGVDIASAALRILEKAAEARAEADARGAGHGAHGAAPGFWPYENGDNLDKAV